MHALAKFTTWSFPLLLFLASFFRLFCFFFRSYCTFLECVVDLSFFLSAENVNWIRFHCKLSSFEKYYLISYHDNTDTQTHTATGYETNQIKRYFHWIITRDVIEKISTQFTRKCNSTKNEADQWIEQLRAHFKIIQLLLQATQMVYQLWHYENYNIRVW